MRRRRSYSSRRNYGASYECALDDAAFEPCRPPLRYDGLAEGGHQLTVRTTSAAAGPTLTARSFTVDRSSPTEFAIAAPPQDGPASARPTISWEPATDAVSRVVRYRVMLDRAPIAAVTAPTTSLMPDTDLAAGPHSLRVVAIDAAGNRRASAARRFVVDPTR